MHGTQWNPTTFDQLEVGDTVLVINHATKTWYSGEIQGFTLRFVSDKSYGAVCLEGQREAILDYQTQWYRGRPAHITEEELQKTNDILNQALVDTADKLRASNERIKELEEQSDSSIKFIDCVFDFTTPVEAYREDIIQTHIDQTAEINRLREKLSLISIVAVCDV